MIIKVSFGGEVTAVHERELVSPIILNEQSWKLTPVFRRVDVGDTVTGTGTMVLRRQSVRTHTWRLENNETCKGVTAISHMDDIYDCETYVCISE